MGITYDIREDIYNEVQSFDMNNLLDFHNNYISGQNRVVMILGDKERLDMEVLKEYGEINYLSLDDIFGY